MPENKPSPGVDVLVVSIILARVLVMLVLWLGVFLSIFLGYFTIPLILLGLASVIYVISDMRMFAAIKRRQKMVDERQEFLQSIEDNPSKDE